MHKGFTQNQPVGSINTKYLFSKSTGNNQYVRVSTGAYMVQFDPGDEERNIIQILSDGESKTIDEIYRELVEADVSAFSDYSEERTEERRLIHRLLHFLRNRRGAVTNDDQKWALSGHAEEIDEPVAGDMSPLDTRRERENILRVIQTSSQPVLADIHSGLVNMDASDFHSLPAHGWNEERHILVALRDTLRENDGLITNGKGGHYQSWSLTEEGEQRVD